ncbi:MAG: LysM peptidoglycan-binding domain-containing protein [Bacteroidia bacterium]|nr:LysM peptidoglycan-binding domain-containing protein [Bacteroidia bacterium]
MKIISWVKALTVVIILLIFSSTVYSQVIVERSKDKVIISGIPYYVHLVKKGETAYSISRAYGIPVEELAKENPPAVYGVNEGQALRIPIKSVIEAVPSEPLAVTKQRDENKFIYHNLKPGETVYFLSKSYGVSENEIILSNPGIDINKLSVGSEVAVPRREFMSSRQKFDDQEKKYIYHKVLKGESLSSISEKYGLTIRELRKENRDLRFPQVDDFVRIPETKTSDNQKIEPVKADSVITIVEEPVITMERQVGYTQVKDIRGSLDVAVLLPFYLKENAERTEIDSSKSINGKKIYKEITRPEEWIYPRSLDFVEMYEGILLAADTLRSLGLDINLYPYDIKSDTIEITKLIMSGKLAGMDLIIGPVYSNNLTPVAAYARDLGIPVVSPVPLINNSALVNNPNLFMASSSLEIAQKTLAKKISEYHDHNFVFIHSDTLGIDEDVKRFKNLIFTELSYKLPYEEIKFKEFIFYSRSMFDNDSINRLSHALSEQSKNIVIIASEEAPVISETIMDVHGLSKKFDIKVFGYPAMRDIDNLDPKYFFDLDIMVYSPYWIDYTKNDVKQFYSDFRQKYLTEPSEKSYAWQGYDISYYFLSGIAMHGKDFIAHPEIHYPDLLQTEYYFMRKEAGNGFENQKLFLIRYTKDYEVKLVEED